MFKNENALIVEETLPKGWIGWDEASRTIKSSFSLVDETNPNQCIEVEAQQETQINMHQGSKNLRNTSKGYSLISMLTPIGTLAIPFISLEVRETTSLSLFGFFKYDSSTDTISAN